MLKIRVRSTLRYEAPACAFMVLAACAGGGNGASPAAPRSNRVHPNGPFALWVMNADGTDAKVLLKSPAAFPTWAAK